MLRITLALLAATSMLASARPAVVESKADRFRRAWPSTSEATASRTGAHLSRRSAGVFDTSYAAAYRLGATAPFGYITWIGFGAEVGDSSTTVLQFKWTAGATASDITTVRYTYYYGIEADNNMSAGYGVTNGWTSSDGTDIDDYSYETSVWNTAANAPYQVTSTWYNPTGSATTSVAIKYWYNSAAANGQIIYAASLDGANAAATSGTLYVADDEFEMFLVDSLL